MLHYSTSLRDRSLRLKVLSHWRLYDNDAVLHKVSPKITVEMPKVFKLAKSVLCLALPLDVEVGRHEYIVITKVTPILPRFLHLVQRRTIFFTNRPVSVEVALNREYIMHIEWSVTYSYFFAFVTENFFVRFLRAWSRTDHLDRSMPLHVSQRNSAFLQLL